MNNMKTIKPKDMACFKGVASIIGEEQAEIELGRVIEGFEEDEDLGFCYQTLENKDLLFSFNWGNSPQGEDFWYDIDDKIIEKELMRVLHRR